MKPKRRLSRSAENLKKMVARYFTEMHAGAAQGKLVTWIAIIVPIELLKGFDLVIAVPENHAAMCAARGAGSSLAEKAEERGYSTDICSYARIDLGAWMEGGKGSPSMGMPKPGLMISNNNNCSLLVKWFDVYRRELGVPHFVLDVPFCYEEQAEKDTQYIVDQYGELIGLIEEMTGQKHDMDRTIEAISYSNEANRLWKEFMDFASHRPAGITAFDSFVHMAPYITSFRGTPELVDHCRLLAEETAELVAARDFPVPNERYRLLWDNIAPWHQLRSMSSRLAGMDANVIYATYTNAIGVREGSVDRFVCDESDPLRSLALIQNGSVCPSGLELRLKAMAEMIERFGINGVVFSGNRSCKPYSVMQLDLMREIEKKTGVPTVMIEVDHADQRKYSEEKEFLKLAAFLEGIDA